MIIAGSRGFTDYLLLRKHVLDYIDAYCELDVEIVTGMAHDGADDMAYHLARWDLQLPYKEFPADWDNLGNPAGYIRNAEMADYAKKVGGSCLIAFWDGVSKGTKHMIDLALKAGLRVVVVYVDISPTPFDIITLEGIDS